MLEALKKLQWTILGHDLLCARVQIDILARSPTRVLTIVEVKSQTARRLGHLTRGQFLRLQRASEFLAQCEPVQIQLALCESNRVLLIPVDGLTHF